MSAKMAEGLRSEQQVRQQARKEIMKGLKSEESARQMVQKGLGVMKEEIKNFKMGSGSTVCSEANTSVGLGASGTSARPPALASRFDEIFIPRKMELKGWITDCTRSSFPGITLNEVMLFIVDLQKMLPNELHQYVDWDLTWTEQGNWPTKTTVNVWFKNETNLATMIGLLEVVKDELKKEPYKIHDQEVSAKLEMTPEKKPLAKAHALFYKGLKAVGGNESKINVVYVKFSNLFLCGRSTGCQIHSCRRRTCRRRLEYQI